MKSLLKLALFSVIFSQMIFISPPPAEPEATMEASSLLACANGGCGCKR